MDIRFRCIHCSQKIAIDETGAGLEIECPNCHATVRVPVAMPRLVRRKPPPIPLQIVTATTPPAAVAFAPAPAATSRSPAPPQPVSRHGAVAHYECTNANCGAILTENQLALEKFGEKTVQLCPKCHLGVRQLTKPISFWTRVPNAFAFPFHGNGIWVLALGTPLLAFVEFGRKLGLGMTVVIGGGTIFCYFGMLLMDVIRTTAVDVNSRMEWPDDITEVGPFMLTSLVVFGPALLCAFIPVGWFVPEAVQNLLDPAKWFLLAGVFALVGILYYPMALLSTAMFTSLAMVNPLVVVPPMFKVPLQYLLVLAVLGMMVGLRHGLAALLMALPIGWRVVAFLPVEFATLYSFVASARLLGLLYFCEAKRFAWFGEDEK